MEYDVAGVGVPGTMSQDAMVHIQTVSLIFFPFLQGILFIMFC